MCLRESIPGACNIYLSLIMHGYQVTRVSQTYIYNYPQPP